MQLVLATLLICHMGGPGTAKQAQPVVDKFLRHLERSGGWPAQSLQGTYATRPARCAKLWEQDKPTIVVTDLATYLSHRKTWKLTPVAHMGPANGLTYHLLVREGGAKKLAEISGKTILTPMANTPRFIARVVFGGKLPASALTLKHTRRPLRAIRALARGKVDAALVDATAYGYLGELKLPKKLISIYRSAGMPQLTLALAGKSGAAERKRLQRALPKLCQGPGAELCKTFGVTSFTPAKKALYKRLERRYGR
ncbi:MAG: PhnD/SsuA/transferrin family substrate-binding protein [Deltaproteobacteria bacterium]|nr:PhnD/SsuA/transferrin family substrate-binding protein [Deltaproteobacteria bacterium]